MLFISKVKSDLNLGNLTLFIGLIFFPLTLILRKKVRLLRFKSEVCENSQNLEKKKNPSCIKLCTHIILHGEA